MGEAGLGARRASGSPSSGWSPRPPPSTHAWPADPTQRTLRVRLRAIEAAGVHHPEVAQREVVLHRIVRIEPAQRRRDVARHRASPGWCSASAAGSGRRGSRACRAARSSLAGDTRVQTPRSSASRRTIQRRNRFSRLQRAARPTAAERNSRRPAAAAPGRRPPADRAPARASRSCRAPRSTSSAPRIVALEEERLRSIPARSSICCSSHSSATRSAPRVQRWTMPANAGAVAARIEARGRRRPARRP